jgi:two-component system, NtrC family, response regulator AlgB
MGEPLKVLVVDDEKNIRSTLGMCLEQLGCDVQGAATVEAACAAQAAASFDLAFLDLRLGSSDGLELIPRLLATQPGLAIVVITAYASVESAVEAIKRGAWDYLPKPFTPAQIRVLVAKAEERQQTTRRIAELEARIAGTAPEVDLHSDSPRMRSILEMLARAAASTAAVLLRGETGTGKSVLARALHARSARAGMPFITVNCPTLSEELLASELFGHARGAFTGAVKDQPGRVEAADGGTLLLDEIAEIPPSLQAKLLRFLQDHEFERVGENRTRRADVRIVSTTNRDLEEDVRSGRFREDLLFRLNVVEITIPALRERPEDIVPLARRMLAVMARAHGRPAADLSAAAEDLLRGHRWPGNLRELHNTLERALILWPATIIEPAAFPERMQSGPATGPQLGGDFDLEEIEREHIQRVLARNKTLDAAAEILGIDASTLWRRRKKYDG